MAKTAAQTLAEQFLPFAKNRAHRFIGGLRGRLPAGSPPVSRDDVLSDAFLGLVKAANSFDPERGVSFSTFAESFVYGAMCDGVKSRFGVCLPVDSDSTSADRVIDDQPTPAEAAEHADSADFIRAGLAERHRGRAKSPDLSGVAIAGQLGITQQAASGRVSRARKILDELDRERVLCN